MNTKQLQAFVAVMEEGSLSAAAQRMNLSLPAASRLVRLLEDHLQVGLFHREHRHLVPTAEAEMFYAEAQRVISAIDDFPKFFVQLRDRSLVPLQVICQLRTAAGLVVPALARLAREMPDLPVSLDVVPRNDLGRSLQRLKFDVGVFILPVPAARIEFEEVLRTRLHVLLPRSHRLSKRAVLRCADLAEERYIALRRGLLAREAVDRALARIGASLTPHYEVSAPSAAHALVAAGAGFAFSDRTALEPEHAARTVLVPWDAMASQDVGIYRPKDSANTVPAARFRTLLKQVWREGEAGRAGTLGSDGRASRSRADPR